MAFVASLTSQASSATESRLTTLSTQLQALARDSDPRAETRLAALLTERASIDEQVAAVESGVFPVLDGERAVERSAEILALASEVPADFARVRAELEELNRDLRARILDDDGDRGDTLGDVFRGVDLIGDSDAGRSFTAFYDMILDPARSSQIDEWIDAVLQRPFASQLTNDQKRTVPRVTDRDGNGWLRSAFDDDIPVPVVASLRPVAALRGTPPVAAVAAQRAAECCCRGHTSPTLRPARPRTGARRYEHRIGRSSSPAQPRRQPRHRTGADPRRRDRRSRRTSKTRPRIRDRYGRTVRQRRGDATRARSRHDR